MISKDRILFAAAEKMIRADMVEKDHALGWLLMGIARHPLLGLWVFKGGTCLKK